MAVNLSPVGGVAGQFFDNNGNPLSGGKIFTYAAGTTTPQITYTSATGFTPHANPIILDAAGRVPGGEIWLTDGLQYKFIIQTSTSVQIGSYDNIIGINSNFVNYTNAQEIQTATAGQTVFTLTTMQYQPGTNSLSVFVDGVNQYGPGAMYAYQETSSTVVTFTAGLHVGAQVKFVTSAINASSYGDAEQISYNPPFSNSVATNVELKLSQYVSVKDFGAVGNDTADDTTAIQAAINAMNAAGGGSIYVPPGTYRITSFLTFYSNISLFGEGLSSRIHLVNSGRSDAFRATGTQLLPLQRISLRDFYVYGDVTFAAGVPSVQNGGGVNFVYTDDCAVRNVHVSGFSDGGIAFLNGNRNVVSGCVIDATAQGLSFNANDVDVTGNVAVGNVVNNTGTYNGIHLEGGFGVSPATGEVRYTTLTGNTVNGAYEAGINIELAPYTACSGNTVNGAGAGATSVNMGIKLFGGFGSAITGNTVRNSNGYGIVVGANSGDCSVSGNVTDDNSGGSILVTDNGTAASYNVALGANSLVEGDIATSGNVSFRNWTPAVTMSNIASADAQTLDWYEENTFVPVVQGSTSAGTATYAVQTGKFTRIGNRVFFELNLQWSGHTGTGNMRIGGLPYPINGAVPGAASMSSNALAPGAGEIFQVYIPQGGVSYLEMRTITQSAGTVAAYAITSGGSLVISGHYSV